jgi:hypothetical protein
VQGDDDYRDEEQGGRGRGYRVDPVEEIADWPVAIGIQYLRSPIG